jgi:hypothetical protein
MYTQNRNKGATLLLCLMFLGMFSGLTVAFFTMATTNVQIANNYRQADAAYGAAESGLEIMRYWLSRFVMPKTTPPDEYLPTIVAYLQHDLHASGVSQIVVRDDGSIPGVPLDTAGSTFSARLRMDENDPGLLRLTVTGAQDGLTRTIEVSFSLAPYQHPIFAYGVAVKGPLQFPQNPTLTGATHPWEADVYVDTDQMIAVDIGGNANFDGDFRLRNPDGQMYCSGDLQIAGDKNEEALANHVFPGAAPVVFPTPDTEMFETLATGPVVDPSTMNFGKGLTLTNATIPPGRNPTFGGTVIIQGVLVVQAPNVVTFKQNCQLNGIIVGVGRADNPEDNQIRFARNFATGPFPAGEQFASLAGVTGTSILAPDFGVSFTGNFSVIDGVVAAGSLSFSGNASAEINGTLISYWDEPFVVDGNIAFNFDRANGNKVPGGFDTHRVLAYNPTSYAMNF